MVELPDELSLIDPGLKEAIEFELSVVLDIINKFLKQPLKLTFPSSGGVRSKIDPCPDGYEMFIPTRFITCLALTLRLLCATRKKVGERMFIATHQHDGEALARDEKRNPVAYEKFRSEPLDPKYLALVGALGDPAELNLLKWWCEEFHLEPSNEFDEFRNGLRYGLLFCILHEAAHVLLDHFNARKLVRGGLMVDLSVNEAVAGFELEADRFAFKNLLYYALFMADLSDPEPTVYSLINSRSWELYRLVYGVYSTLSLFDVSKWVSGDYAKEIYFHPGDRVYLNLIL